MDEIKSKSAKTSGSVQTTKNLLICGILSSLLYAAMNIFIAMLYEGYNSVTQTVSELSAINAPTRQLWVSLGFVYTFLVIAFGFGILRSADGNRSLRIVGKMILAYGIVGIGWPLAPMHLREVLASGESTLSDTMHIVITIVTVILMLIAMGFGAAVFGKQFRIYSIVTMLTLLLFGVLTSMEAPGIDANLPTPMIGVWERINIGVFLLWIVVLALILLQRIKLKAQVSNEISSH